MMNNPFQIKTPEKLNADETLSLFVDVFTDYQKIKTEGHTLLLGPRGIGKSMMLRFLQPDCQCLYYNGTVSDIDFIGIYIPLRNASFTSVTELRRLEYNAAQIINEHIMSVYVLQRVFKTLENESIYGKIADSLNEQAREYFSVVCKDFFGDIECDGVEDRSINEVFNSLASKMELYYNQTIDYTKRLSFTKEVYPYKGPLFDYLSVVIPVVNHLQEIECFKGKKVFFLIDDAHCMTELQTHIMNYWVSTRTSGDISLKISTQYNYKNYFTITGATIDAPHDYSEVDMMKVYTSKVKRVYVERITEIVEKRLKKAGINCTPHDFFPEDEKQEERIREIAEEYRKRYDKGEGRGNKRSDDAIRYSRPDYIKSLTGKSKSSYTYSYAGFEQLIHLSSGIARFFLESAYKMFAEEQTEKPKEEIACISKQVQNRVVRDEANQFLFNELPKYAHHSSECDVISKVEYPEEDIRKLSNLINGLGGLFRAILLSDRTERRVFSIAISDFASNEVKRVLDLGIQLGYFHKTTIGKKDSTTGGRTDLYILNRRLAPIWTLDPTSFASYLFVKNELLEEAMYNPDALLRRISKTINEEDDVSSGVVQLSFFSTDSTQLYTIENGDEDER